MKMTLVFAAAAACFALSACTSFPMQTKDKPPLDCQKANSCEVPVSVLCLLGCEASVANDVVIISAKNGKDSITWKLPDESIYSFAPNAQGMVFDEKGKRAFECKSESHRLTCRDRSKDPETYKYTLGVVGPFGTVWSHDPWVINN